MQQLTINVADARLDVLLNFLHTLDYVEVVNKINKGDKAKPKKKKMTQSEMAASFRLAANDSEMRSMVEEGLDDYAKITIQK